MGCSDPQEKLENEIMKMNMDKIEIQMERYKQMKLLEEKSNNLNAKIIPDNVYNTNNDIIINKKIRKSLGGKKIKSKNIINRAHRSKSVKTVNRPKINNNIKVE